MQKNKLAICYGNDLIGNDALGKAVYEILPPEVNKIFSIQLLPELLEKAMEFDEIVFVDAAYGDSSPSLTEIFAREDGNADFHSLSAEGFLKLLEVLYSKTPKAYMCVAYFQNFEIGKLDDDFWQKRDDTAKIALDILQ